MSLTAEQRELRRTGITATDATAIAGVNRFRSALQVYAEKTGELSPESSEQAQQGLELEPWILDHLARTRGLRLAEATTERHPILSWVLATPDRFVVEGADQRIGVAEAKNVGHRMLRDWPEDEPDQVPDYVHVQVQWQMLTTRTKRAWVAALLGGRDFRVVELEHDEDLATTLLEVCDRFWRTYVVPRVVPPADASTSARETLARMFPRHSSGIVAAPAEAERWAEQYLLARMAIAPLQRQLDEAQNNLQRLCADHEGLAAPTWQLTWRQASGGGTDWRAVAEAMGAPKELIAAHKRPGTRRFLLRETSR